MISFQTLNYSINKKSDLDPSSLKTGTPGANPVWSYTTGGYISSVAISGNGSYIVAGSETDYKVYLFSNISSTPLWSDDFGSAIMSVDISSNGEYIIAGGGQELRLYQKDSSTPLWTYTNPSNTVFTTKISSNASMIIIQAGLHLFVFNTSSSTPEIPEWEYLGGITSIAISENGKYIVAGSSIDKKVYLFNQSSAIPIWTYDSNTEIKTVDISANGSYIVAGGEKGLDHKLYLFNNSDATPIWTYNISKPPTSIAISSEGEYIVAGTGWDFTLYILNNSVTFPKEAEWNYTSNYACDQVDISFNGTYVAVAGDNNKVYLFNRSSSTPLWIYSTGSSVSSIEISVDENYIVAGNIGGKVCLFSTKNLSGGGGDISFGISVVPIVLISAIALAFFLIIRKDKLKI